MSRPSTMLPEDLVSIRQKPDEFKIWEATQKQKIMLSSTATYILFGGSRGGGKTDGAMRWFLYDIGYKEFRGLVIRRNAKDLVDFVDRATDCWRPYGVKKTGNPAVFHFPSGAVIYTGHLGTPDAYTAYQGWELHKILIEELTHIATKSQFEKLMGSLRSTHKHLTPQFLATTNPGNAGAEWVKAYWKIGKKKESVKFTDDDGLVKLYVPATIYDNKHLVDADPDYVKYLESLPPTLKAQWLEGSWEDFDIDGAYYANIIKELKQRGHFTRVRPENSLEVYTAWDIGGAGGGDATAIWFFQLYGNEVRVLHYYEHTGEGMRFYIDYCNTWKTKNRISFAKHYGPHDIEVTEYGSGVSRIETARKMNFNFVVTPKWGVQDGIEAVRTILPQCFFDEDETREGVHALRNYRKEFDEKRNVFVSKPLHDWASNGADGFRYLAVNVKKAFNDQYTPQHNQQQGGNDWKVF